MGELDVRSEIFKLACDTSDGTISAIDSAHAIEALMDRVRIDEIQRIPVFEVDDEPGNVAQYLDDRLKALKATNEERR